MNTASKHESGQKKDIRAKCGICLFFVYFYICTKFQTPMYFVKRWQSQMVACVDLTLKHHRFVMCYVANLQSLRPFQLQGAALLL